MTNTVDLEELHRGYLLTDKGQKVVDLLKQGHDFDTALGMVESEDETAVN